MSLDLSGRPLRLGRRALLDLFSHRTLALLRWDLHFLRLRVTGVYGLRLRVARLLQSRERPLYLNLGSGPRGLDDPHWVNVDGFPDANVHLLLDIARPLPFPGATFAGAFSEHVLEHFGLEYAEHIAREVRRSLAPGGVFRVIVPDGVWIMSRYFDGGFPHQPEDWTRMEVVNDYFRQRYEHQFIYDAETMCRLLTRAGFSQINVVGFREGCELRELDDPVYAAESLYVDAYA